MEWKDFVVELNRIADITRACVESKYTQEYDGVYLDPLTMDDITVTREQVSVALRQIHNAPGFRGTALHLTIVNNLIWCCIAYNIPLPLPDIETEDGDTSIYRLRFPYHVIYIHDMEIQLEIHAMYLRVFPLFNELTINKTRLP